MRDRVKRAEYLRMRRLADAAAGRCTKCRSRPASPGVKNCAHCQEQNTASKATGGYVPWDELLARPSIRILRVMAHMGWVGSSVVMDALGLGKDDVDYRRHKNTLSPDLVESGCVEIRNDLGLPVYRITPAGRTWLAKQLARADVGVATDEEAA